MSEKKARWFSIKFSAVEKVVTILSGIASIVTIAGFIIIYIQLRDIKKVGYDRSAQLLGLYDQEFFSGMNVEVRHAIERDDHPLLTEHGGSITDEQLEDYLNIFEALSDSSERGLIDPEMLYIYQSHYIEKAYLNEEVREYIDEI